MCVEIVVKWVEDIVFVVVFEDVSMMKKGIVQFSSVINSMFEMLVVMLKVVKLVYDNVEKCLQKDQNGVDIFDKGCFLNNINVVSKIDFVDKCGMCYVWVNVFVGVIFGKYYFVVVMCFVGLVSELVLRVIIIMVM